MPQTKSAFQEKINPSKEENIELPDQDLKHFDFLKKKDPRYLVTLFLIPLGLGIYMIYLYRITGDPINFLNTISIFGDQRSASLIFLPQVFYRYIFKILPNLSWGYFPVVFTTVLEFGIANLFLLLIIVSFKKVRLDYVVFSFLTYLIPTFSGSFSSMPRYVLAAFPLFMMMTIYLIRWPKYLSYLVVALLILLQAVSLSLFARGFWLS